MSAPPWASPWTSRSRATPTLSFTTGTTGKPKGVVPHHANIAHAALNISTFLQQTPDDVEVVPVPLSHSFGLGRLRCMARVGNALVLADGLKSPTAVLESLTAHRATGFALVPAGFALLRRLTGDLLAAAAGHLRYVEIGSAALAPCGARVVAAIAPVDAYLPSLRANRGVARSVRRRALGGRTARFDRRGEPARELVGGRRRRSAARRRPRGRALGARGMVMREYLGMPELTAATLVHGALRTGDFGCRDEEGNFWLKGRMGDLIHVGGLKASPDEIEAFLKGYDGIVEAACIGVPDPSEITGERVKAFVVSRDPVDAAAVSDWLRARGLEPHKVPIAYERVEALPKTASGKLARHRLRDMPPDGPRGVRAPK